MSDLKKGSELPPSSPIRKRLIKFNVRCNLWKKSARDSKTRGDPERRPMTLKTIRATNLAAAKAKIDKRYQTDSLGVS